MRSSWADSVANAENSAAASGASANNSATAALSSRPSRSTYVPPHLRNRPVTPEPPASSPADAPSAPQRPSGFAPPGGAPRWGGGGGGGSGSGGPVRDLGRPGFAGSSSRGGGSGGGGGGWNSRTGGWDRREREANPFANDDSADANFEGQENTGINFDAYEDIPVETSGNDVPPPVNTFAEIDLGHALNENIQRCKYVKPTPVQRHAIPISLAGRDLMACAQTGSGKTAAFCFPIISGIMRGQAPQRQRGSRTAYPLALILSPTRELSAQVCLKFYLFICLLFRATCNYG